MANKRELASEIRELKENQGDVSALRETLIARKVGVVHLRH